MSTTTAEAIRDRILDVLEALVPRVLAGDRFIRYRNEHDGDFVAWAETYPTAALRRVQVRDTGDDEPPIVTGGDVELRRITIEIMVAYPQTARAGNANALGRDDVASSDQDLIEHAVGEWGAGRFVAPHPEASWERGDATVAVGNNGVDFLIIRQSMLFWRSMP